jgi:hypothetical protein
MKERGDYFLSVIYPPIHRHSPTHIIIFHYFPMVLYPPNDMILVSSHLLPKITRKSNLSKYSPFNNPTETYRYYSLPFCRTHADQDEHEAAIEDELANSGSGGTDTDEEDEEGFGSIMASATARRIMGDRVGAERHKQRLGESIVGDRRETSPYELSFQDDIEWRLLCKTTLGTKELTKFKEAIHNNYFFEMFIEDLPMWGYIGDVEDEDAILGETEGSRTYLFPHLHYKIGTNNAQIVSVVVTTERDRRVDITNVNKPTTVQFSYSVEWFEDHELPWKMRMTRYADSRFLPGSFEIHWLSIINSFVLVLLLTAFLTIILMRVLKNDFSRYMELDDESMEEEEVRYLTSFICSASITPTLLAGGLMPHVLVVR